MNGQPDYYKGNGISPIDAFRQGLLSKEEYIGFIKGNVIKYTVRAGRKTVSVDSDCDKAIHYLEMLKELSHER